MPSKSVGYHINGQEESSPGNETIPNVSNLSDDEKRLRCIPLVYPDNYEWNRKEGRLIEKSKVRSKLNVCQEAMEIINSIDGPICPVVVVGPARTGKSYITSQLLDPRPDECVFKTSRAMRPETFGIWMSTQPYKRKLANGMVVTILLLDTEGIGSYAADADNDNRIFTLSVLLSSVLVYNSKGDPTLEDLQKFRCIGELATKIQVRPPRENSIEYQHSDDFYKYFPNFLWLLRDVTLYPSIEKDGKEVEVDIKSFVLSEVLKKYDDKQKLTPFMQKHNDIRTAILTYFPNFDVFSLPIPTTDGRILQSMGYGDYLDHVSTEFRCGVETFISKVVGLMKTKKTITGMIPANYFSQLVKVYVDALENTDSVSNIWEAWHDIMRSKLRIALGHGCQHYSKKMESIIDELPCDEERILTKHNDSLKEALELLNNESKNIYDVDLIMEFTKKLKDHTGFYNTVKKQYDAGRLSYYLSENAKQSDKLCKQLVEDLCSRIVEPLQIKLTNNDGVTFQLIRDTFDDVTTQYNETAKGPFASKILTTHLMQIFDDFYVNNVKCVHQLPDYETLQGEGLEEFKAEYRKHLDRVQEEENSALEKEALQQCRTYEIEEFSVLRENAEKVLEQKKVDARQRYSALMMQIDTLVNSNANVVEELEILKKRCHRESVIYGVTMDEVLDTINEKLGESQNKEKRKKCSIQ
ncbi:guanylate-binding protein 1-like [Glandiceps talaboti]